MAKLQFARDSHPYLTHGYPVLRPDGREDRGFATYQVYPRAEKLFEAAGIVAGESVPRETFFALLTDGDLYNGTRPHGIPISLVPSATRVEAENIAATLLKNEWVDSRAFCNATYLLDVFRLMQQQEAVWKREQRLKAAAIVGTPRIALSAASWYCLFRRVIGFWAGGRPHRSFRRPPYARH